jgi:radical SAM protein with 4Fe4S-binding SPASM domain
MWLTIKDTVRLLTFRRLLNLSKIFGSYFFSRITGKPLIAGFPFSISVEPTTSCNLRCPECPSGLRSFTRPTGMMKNNLFETFLEQQHDTLLYLNFYFQGEPYLNKDFLDMVKLAGSKNIYTSTSTNAHYLNDENCRKTIESGLNRMIISIDGTTQEIYQQYRVGGSLDKVVEGTQRLVRWKKQLGSKTPYILFQFLVVKPNEHQIEDAMKLAEELEVDEIKFKTAQIYDYEFGSPLIPDNKKYSRYVLQPDGTYAIKNKLLNHCWKMWHSCVITWDGAVVPCCFDKDATHQMGNVMNQDFKNIWKGNTYQQFRSALLTGRSQIDICKNCSEGTKVWAS